jgi:predicted transcriptional regulator
MGYRRLVCIQFRDEVLEELDRVARSLDLSRSALIRLAAADFVRRQATCDRRAQEETRRVS